jgi:hypothetical protein
VVFAVCTLGLVGHPATESWCLFQAAMPNCAWGMEVKLVVAGCLLVANHQELL